MPISEATYDVVLASHVLEHVANPLRALQEWNRVLRSNGTILAIVPCKWRNFDRKREFTSFEHILEDFERNVSEDDLTHIDEILSFHDLDLDPLAGSLAEFKERCAKNASVRAMHHHVFSPETLIAVFDYMRMRVLHIAVERPDHIIILAQKISPAEYTAVQSYNQSFLQPAAKWRRHDPIGASSARLQMNGRRG
jgi:SAM-dependent methyltransferase